MNAKPVADEVVVVPADGLTEAEKAMAREVGHLLAERVAALSLPRRFKSIIWTWKRRGCILSPVVTFCFDGCSFDTVINADCSISEVADEELTRRILVELRSHWRSLASWLGPADHLPR